MIEHLISTQKNIQSRQDNGTICCDPSSKNFQIVVSLIFSGYQLQRISQQSSLCPGSLRFTVSNRQTPLFLFSFFLERQILHRIPPISQILSHMAPTLLEPATSTLMGYSHTDEPRIYISQIPCTRDGNGSGFSAPVYNIHIRTRPITRLKTVIGFNNR